MVFRVHKTDNYTVMSNHHLRNVNLTLKAKGLMSLMLSLPDDWDYSAKGLSTLSVGGEDAVKSALKELEEQHYLKRTPIREKGVIRDWQYDIYENPESLENRAFEPEVEKPLVAEPLVEKQSQINTKEVNTKEKSINNSTNVELGQATPTHRHLITVNDSLNTATPHKNKKKNLYEKCVDEIDSYTTNEESKSLLTTYLKVRLEMKQYPLYASMWKGYLNELRRLVNLGQNEREVIQQSINRGYRGFFEVKQYNKRAGQDKSVFSEYGTVKTGNSGKGVLANVQF